MSYLEQLPYVLISETETVTFTGTTRAPVRTTGVYYGDHYEELPTFDIPRSRAGELARHPTQSAEFPINKLISLLPPRLLENKERLDKMSLWGPDALHDFARSIGLAGQKPCVDIDQLRGLKVVDLGCGSEGDPTRIYNNEHGSLYRPWLCRFLHAAEVDVTGVDYCYPYYEGSNDSAQPCTEGWKFIQGNFLTDPVAARIGERCYDVVNAKSVIGHTEGEDLNTSPSFAPPDISSRYYQDLEAALFQRALRMLKLGGVFVVNADRVYEKVGGPVRFQFKEINDNGVGRVKGITDWDPVFVQAYIEERARELLA